MVGYYKDSARSISEGNYWQVWVVGAAVIMVGGTSISLCQVIPVDDELCRPLGPLWIAAKLARVLLRYCLHLLA